jgi:hypothetical protein
MNKGMKKCKKYIENYVSTQHSHLKKRHRFHKFTQIIICFDYNIFFKLYKISGIQSYKALKSVIIYEICVRNF